MREEPLDDEPFTGEQAVVAAANEAFYQAVEDGDLDRLRALWIGGEYSDTVHCVHPGQPAVHGRARVLMSWAVVMSRLTYLQFIITDLRVVVGSEIAVVTCTENVLTDLARTEPGEDARDADDEAPAGFAGGRAEATNVFRRCADGRWLLFSHHSSPIFPE
ncbi:MAG TPA: nuclear transport factor 2 family protein [Actinocrinis sp.]